MRKILLTSALAVMAIFSAGAQYVGSQMTYPSLDDSELVAAMRSHIEYIASPAREGRKAGSEGELETAVYIHDVLKGYGIDMISPEDGELFGLRGASGDTLVSRNVIGFIQGYDRDLSKRYIVIGARMDNLGMNNLSVNGQKQHQVFQGANGNASGIAMMLELARKIKTNQIVFARSVVFVGFGASFEGMAGSYYFLSRTFARERDNVDLMINLDCLGGEEGGFYAYTSSNDDVNQMINTLNAEVFPLRPELTSNEIYPSDHRAFYSAEIPSVHFTSGRYVQHNSPKDTPDLIDYDKMEFELEYLYAFAQHAAAPTTDAPSFRRTTVVSKPDLTKDDDVVSYFDTSTRPAFGNSYDPDKFLKDWVYYYLKYPKEAVQQGIQGKVTVGYIIEKDGKLSNVHIVKGADPLLDEEALRVVKASPAWRPGRLNGQKVRTAMNIVVEFRLERNTKGKFGINNRTF